MFDQVNFLPYRTISLMPRAQIAELNLNISDRSPPGLFLSSGFSNEIKIS